VLLILHGKEREMMKWIAMKKLSRKRDDGFTLIEIMISILVFTIGILAVVSMQTSSLHGNKIARETTEAAAVAASAIESLRPLDYADPSLTDGTHTLPGQDQYAITYNVRRNTIIENTMLIEVSVTWTERGIPKRVELPLIKFDII
jgi:type IV pilus assembly protein PilV